MRYEKFKERECYYVCSKGARAEEIFLDDADRARFLFLITHLQSPIQIYNVSWYAKSLLRHDRPHMGVAKIKRILNKRHVELLAFVLLPNQFELLVKNLEDSILSVYMHRVLTAYSKYFNAKYSKRGKVFRAPFEAAKIKAQAKLPEISALIHQKTPDRWSSYQDYIGENRWGDLVPTYNIMKQFGNQSEYKKFVENFNPNTPK